METQFELNIELPETSPATGTDYSNADVLAMVREAGYDPESIATSVDLEKTLSSLEEEQGIQETSIRREYETAIKEATELQKKEVGGAKATTGRFAGGMGLDTASQGYINMVMETGEKRISSLKKEMKDAIANNNVTYQQKIQTAIDNEQDRITEARNQMWDRAVDVINLGVTLRSEQRAELEEQRQWGQLGLDYQKFVTSEERSIAYLSIAQAQEARSASKEQIENAVSTLNKMAQSNFDISSLTDEQKSEIEYSAGIPSGTLEAFYDKLVKDVQNGEVLDNLKIEKARADLANTWSQIQKRNLGISGKGLTDDQLSQYLPTVEVLTRSAIDENGNINIDVVNSIIEGYSQEDKSIIKNLFFEYLTAEQTNDGSIGISPELEQGIEDYYSGAFTEEVAKQVAANKGYFTLDRLRGEEYASAGLPTHFDFDQIEKMLAGNQ